MPTAFIAYGLTIASELPLPELVAGEGRADVVIRLGQVERLPEDVGRSGDYVRASADEATLFWENLGAFQVRQGREIIVEPAPGVDERQLRAFLLGSTLGVLLHQRGLLTLHASAVEIEGGAVAFIGWKGQGKSTTAAALHARGYRLLTDDIVALDMSDPAGPLAYPGFPQIKLRPDAASAVLGNADALPRLHPEINKLVHRADAAFTPAPLPLRAIFMLAEGPEPAVEPVRTRDALLALVSHSYALRFINVAGISSAHFQQTERLAKQVPLSLLRRPDALERLPEALDLVEAQVSLQPQLA